MAVDDIHGFGDFHDLYSRMVHRAATLDLPMVEVGVWCGRSLLYAAQEAKEKYPHWKKLIGVDTFKDLAETIGYMNRTPEYDGGEYAHLYPPYASLFSALSHREQLGLKEYAHIIVGESVATASLFRDHSLASVFIDASHDYESVKTDLNAWGEKVAYNGIIAGHDYYHPPVAQAVNEYFSLGKVIEDGPCWIGIRNVSES